VSSFYPVPNDSRFPKLARALDPKVMFELIQNEFNRMNHESPFRLRECLPVYLRYKPGVSCIIGYNLIISDNGDNSRIQSVYGRFVPSGEIKEAYEKSLKTHTSVPLYGPPVMNIQELNMILSFFPNDRSLRGLRFILDPDKLKRIAQRSIQSRIKEPWWIRARHTTIDILTHKPERHCVVRCQLYLRNVDTRGRKRMNVIGKMLKKEEGEYIYKINQQLWNECRLTEKIPIIPEPLAFDSSATLFFQEEISGQHPSPRGISREKWFTILGQIVETLKTFHGLKLNALRSFSLAEEFDDLKKSIDEAVRVLPEKRDEMLDLYNQLEMTIHNQKENSFGPTHGDFHIEQILLGKKRPVIIDLDEVRASDRLWDVANFTAHLSKYLREGSFSRDEAEDTETKFIEQYFGGEDFSLHKTSYLWLKKASLIKLALSCLKYLPANWQDDMSFYLKEARQL
jgi:hypothetical protein